VEWKIVNEGGNGTRSLRYRCMTIRLAKGFGRSAFTTTASLPRSSPSTCADHGGAKAGKPTVVIHCAIANYRSAELMTGANSSRHQPPTMTPRLGVPGLCAAGILRCTSGDFVSAKAFV